MNPNKNLLKNSLIFTLLALPILSHSQTDQIYLKDGGTMSGLILEEIPFEYLKIQFPDFELITVLDEDIDDVYRPIAIKGFWDVIYSKNGGILRGFITEYYRNDRLVIENERGDLLEFPMAEIRKITKERTPEGEVAKKSTIGARKARNAERKSQKSRNYGFTLYFAEMGGMLVTDQGGVKYPGVFFNQILSYQFNDRFALGGGIGFDGLYNVGGNDQNDLGRVIFADSRLYFSQHKLRPWFAMSGGYDWFRDGWTASSAMGANIPIFKGININLGAGLRIQKIGDSNNINNLRGLLEMVQFRIVLD
ncbi:MAG: hypothetical protein KDD99_18895 [Bacteroidetes bacterium]|nr:hypothetical protein [Bacteroidota bacterium]